MQEHYGLFMPITRRQQQVYDFLVNHFQGTDEAPTLDEICEALGVKSRGSMHKHISALIDEGLLEAPGHRHRGIRLKRSEENELHHLPMMGYIAAGRPLEAISEPETIQIPRNLYTTDKCYVLQVKGDSMIEDGIYDGDWVIIEPAEQARNHTVVVALVDRSEVTLKRIEQKPGVIFLHPANNDMEAMQYEPERVEVQGVLVGQMRRYF